MTNAQTAAHIEQIDSYLAFAITARQISKRRVAEYRAERARAWAHLMAITATEGDDAMSDADLLAELGA